MAYSREIEKLQRQFEENPRRFAAPFADALRKSDEVERALEVIRVGLELNPDYIPGSVILGRCHLDMGNDEGAEAAFSRVLDLDNENVIALKSLADIMERQGRSDEAISFLTYLLDVDRSNDEAREQLERIRGTPAAAAPAIESAAPPTAGDTAPPPQPFFGALPADEPPSPVPQVEEFLEPTALWEPPVGASEAAISSWVEPTAAAAEPVDAGDSLLEEPASPADVTPMDGFEPVEFRGDADDTAGASRFEEFVLEREEEIVLHSSSGAEYQVANDSESLLERTSAPSEPEAPSAPEAAPEPEPEPEPSTVTSSSSVIAEEIEATRPAEPLLPAVEEEAPLEWAMHVGEEQEFVPAGPTHSGVHPPDSFDAAIEGIAPVDEEGDVGEPEDDASEAESGAPVLMVTESMAELYAAQGHPGEALGVYRILYDRNPDNERLRLRIVELESVLAARVIEDAAPSFAASVTGGKAVASFLGAMLDARPPQVDIPEPPPAPELTPATEASDAGDEEAVASGAPTRPAIDRLSLGAIFGEDPSPVPPAANTTPNEKPEGASGFSFDEFFGGGEAVSTGRTSSGSVRAARASDDEDDLDQFHSWLQSLKR
ncbi:MAG TPA: tetratricopeptide repeat protein [Gemmatimonadales bacterium]|nr:tetratricopeptide repeat protein [Gemmatimonadales bacterium]HRZ09790.1 tetratricopeptide repeat protein [Gemmatimonadales bacterium]